MHANQDENFPTVLICPLEWYRTALICIWVCTVLHSVS